jgi:hypothetical protein
MTSSILRRSERVDMFQNLISTVRGEAASKPSVGDLLLPRRTKRRLPRHQPPVRQ